MSDSQQRPSSVSLDRSVERVSRATPTDERTDGLTENLQDQGDNLTPRNAHEQSRSVEEVGGLAGTLAAVSEQVARGGERAPVVRGPEDRQLDPRIRQAVLTRDGFTCRWCHRNADEVGAMEIDHIVHWSARGSDATDNLRTLCQDCNQARSNYRTDSETATALLIVGQCGRCHDELGEEVAVWCLDCRRPSSTSITHANRVRSQQASRPRPRCDTHGVSLPCAGCRADELVNPAPKPSEPDGRMRAAGER